VHTISGKGYRFVAIKNGTAPTAVPRPEVLQPLWGQPPRLSSGPEVPGRSLTTIDTPETTARSSSKTFKVVTSALCLIFAALFTYLFRNRLFTPPSPEIHSIAVIPLYNLSADRAQDYFADGMTDELITMLAKNTTLRVVSRTSVMQYKSPQRPVREIARDLGVDGILEGSVRQLSGRVQMNVQLIYAPDDRHIWAESYDRDLDQAFLLPTEVSQAIAKEVQVQKTSTSAPPRYINPEAYDAYLHGRYFWFTFDTKQTLPYFEKAIELQPDYAAAWSGLADTYALAGMLEDMPPLEATHKSEAAARKALELDDSLPEAHNSLAAWYLFYGWDPANADVECRRALELNPNYAEGHYVRHYALLALSLAEAEIEENKSVELDPFARPWGLGAFYIDSRQFDLAINELRMQSRARPSDGGTAMFLSNAYWLTGRYEESQQELEEGLHLQRNPKDAAAAHKAWKRGGEKAVEQWRASKIKAQARQHHVRNWDIASILAFTGDKDETLKYLEAAYLNHSPNLIGLQNEPGFDFLHSDRRYQALAKKIRLRPAP
jgi:TolB-like protein